MLDNNCLEKMKTIIELAEKQKDALKVENYWKDETAGTSVIDDGHDHGKPGIILPGVHNYFLVRVIIEGSSGRHTAVSTVLYVNEKPVSPISSGDTDDSSKTPICNTVVPPFNEDMDGKQTKIYEYAISDATSVKLTGHISTMCSCSRLKADVLAFICFFAHINCK